MAQSAFTGESDSYIFDGAGGARDHLEQAILQELQSKQYPLRATIQSMSSGKGLLGSLLATKEQCVVIDGGKTFEIVVANTTVGTYLYVEVYLNVKVGLFGAKTMSSWDVFENMKRSAFYSAAKDAVESAFSKLQLRQMNRGYISMKKETSSGS